MTSASSNGLPSRAGAVSGRELRSLRRRFRRIAGELCRRGLGRRAGRPRLGRLLARLPVLIGAMCQRAQYGGTAIARNAAGDLADLLAHFLVADQQAKHAAGREGPPRRRSSRYRPDGSGRPAPPRWHGRPRWGLETVRECLVGSCLPLIRTVPEIGRGRANHNWPGHATSRHEGLLSRNGGLSVRSMVRDGLPFRLSGLLTLS